MLSLAAAAGLGEATANMQLLATISTGDDLPLLAAWAPDGLRLAYATEKRIERKRSPLSVEEGPIVHYPGEVWLTDFQAKPKRLLKHDFLRTQEGDFFSFSVERLAWAPDGRKLLVEITDEKKNTATFLITDTGDRVKLGSTPVNYVSGYGGAWLADSDSVGLLEEAVSPRLLHRIGLVRVVGGRVLPLFPKKTFAAVAWLPGQHKAVAVERDPEFAAPPRLVLADLDNSRLQELDALREGYLGGLQASPDGAKVSYFVGQEKLAVRGPEPGAVVEYWPIPFGRYQWAGPRPAVLYLEAEEPGARAGRLLLYLPRQEQKLRVLDELIQDFWVSADGERIAVLTAGDKADLKVYHMQPQR